MFRCAAGRRGRSLDEQFQVFLDAMPDATLVVSQDGLIRAVNPSAARLFGYGAGELVGRSARALIPQRFRDAHDEHQRDFFAVPRVRPMGAALDIRGLTRDGRELPLEISLSPVPMPDGTICVIAALRDMTRRKDWERALERAKYLAENIVDTVRQPLVVLTPDLKVRAANDAFYKTFEIGRERVEGRFFHDIGSHDWDNPQLRDLLARVLTSDQEVTDFEFEHDFERLGRRIMCLNARRIDSLQLVLLAIEDITERTRGQRALQESEERLHLALEAGKLGTWDMDLVRGTTYWDPICRAIFGIGEDEPAGLERGVDIIHPEDRAAALRALEEATAPGSPGFYEMEKRILCQDGTVRWVATCGRVLFAGDGAERRAVRIIGVAVETTERRRAEAALRAAKEEAERANALKSRFLAATSHDLRQPLQTLRLLQAVLARTVVEAASRKIIEDLGQTITSMAEIVDTLLDINRLESGAIEPELIDFPINSALLRVQSDFRHPAVARGAISGWFRRRRWCAPIPACWTG